MSPQAQKPISSRKRPRISSEGLPDDVVELILSYLPVKNATSLSVLSKRFARSWRWSRDLSFGKDLARKLSKDKLISLVQRLLHDPAATHLTRFHLYFNPDQEMDLVHSWVEAAIRRGITELDLDFSSSNKSFLLSAIPTNIHSLKVLKLNKCEVDYIHSFQGSCRLMHVTFQNVEIGLTTLQSVLCHCHTLTTLELADCRFTNSLRIIALHLKWFRSLVVRNRVNTKFMCVTAPSLRSFHYHGRTCLIKFHLDFPHLNDVVLNISPPRSSKVLPGVKEMLPTLAGVTTLTVSSSFFEVLCSKFREHPHLEMAFSFNYLKEFHLILKGESHVNPLDVAFLLSKCLRIERVFIDLQRRAFAGSDFWNTYGRRRFLEFNRTFPFMKCAKMKGFTFKDMHLLMAGMFLTNAPNLQNLVLVKAKYEERDTPKGFGQEIFEDARTEVFKYLKDKSGIIPKHPKLT